MTTTFCLHTWQNNPARHRKTHQKKNETNAMETQINQFLRDKYEIWPTQINYIRSSVNEVYHILTDTQTYYLRIQPEQHLLGSGRLKIESMILRQLSDSPQPINLPHPIPQQDGKIVGEISITQIQRDVVLLTAIPGKQIKLRQLTTKQLTQISSAIAELHHSLERINHTNHIQLLDIISRGLDSYENNLELFQSAHHTDHLSWAREVIDQIKELHLPQQLLHGDLWWKNILLHHNQIGFIDFDFSMIGPRSYDLAAFLATQKSDQIKLPAKLEQMMIDHYQQQYEREFDQDEIKLSQQLRQLWIFEYWLKHSNKPIEKIETMILNNLNVARNL